MQVCPRNPGESGCMLEDSVRAGARDAVCGTCFNLYGPRSTLC